jgi:phosphomannomutase
MSIVWKDLQNGSDIRGIAMDGVSGEVVNLTPEVVQIIAGSFAMWLSEVKNKPANSLKIGIGRDSRLTGPSLCQACFKGLTGAGVEVFDCGLASTPAMFMATIFDDTRFDGSIMLTASHLPFNRNGMKFFTDKGGLDKPDITKILDYCAKGSVQPGKPTANIHSHNILDTYSQFLVNTIRKSVNDTKNFEKPLLGFHIVVDAGNGSGGFFADKVLKPLGADTTGSVYLEPDGNFPNHIPNPEDKEAMAAISSAVKTSKADLGIIFDTDVDRAAAVDKGGNEINRNKLIALISAIVLEEHPGTTIVTDSITSDGLTQFIEGPLKGKHHRFKRGYKNVINEAIRLNNENIPSWCVIETSGHAALRENFFLDDGAFIITKILIKAARLKLENQTIESLTKGFTLPAESEEFRIKIKDPDFKSYGNKVIDDLKNFIPKINGWTIVPRNYEGLRVTCGAGAGKGWFLLRLSLHDPVIPLNIESDEPGGVKTIAQHLKSFFQQYDKLDASAVAKYV